MSQDPFAELKQRQREMWASFAPFATFTTPAAANLVRFADPQAGESVLDALKREFAEEIGVQIVDAEPWCGVEHVYPHAHVRLHFYISRDWQGEPNALEGQQLAWQGSVLVEPVLPATIPLLESLAALR